MNFCSRDNQILEDIKNVPVSELAASEIRAPRISQKYLDAKNSLTRSIPSLSQALIQLSQKLSA